MTDDEIDALHAKLRRARGPFDEAQKQAEEMVSSLKSVLRGFEKRDHYNSCNIVQPSFKPGASTWPDKVPTSDEIIDVLTRWHDARETLVAAYNALPDPEKKHIAEIPRTARDW